MWNEKMIDILRRGYANHEDCETIAKNLNITKSAVKNKAWRIGIKYTSGRKCEV
jgi:hypothetical protein